MLRVAEAQLLGAATYGTAVQLQALSADASSWVNVGNNFSANAVQTYDLASHCQRKGRRVYGDSLRPESTGQARVGGE
jgi:hypothetical protein